MSETQPSSPLFVPRPQGIGGYLIIPMLGLALMPVAALVMLKLPENFGLLTAAPKTFVAAVIFAYVAIWVACPVGLLILMLTKKRKFPRLYMIWATISPVAALVLLATTELLFGDALDAQRVDLFDRETARGIYGSITYSVVWILYMQKSQRVQNTFIQ